MILAGPGFVFVFRSFLDEAREAEAARRAEQSPAAKLKAAEAKGAAKAREDAELWHPRPRQKP